MGREVVRFRKVLHVRTIEREITQSELAGRLQEEGLILDKLNEMKALHDNAMSDFCGGRGEAVSLQQLWFERQSIDVMEQNLNDGRQELETCRYRIEETKAELLAKHQNVQLMERYVDRLKERAAKELIDQEQKNLDDITSMRYLLGRGKEADL
jgi:flagellar export protein FliJ